ncbi:DivIVA domain-containing protein [Bifidobacterium sp. ESL0690]|uniref:DivIVA domain-containing protein n=1 Tax=Bifidobacterium sp. ESL0690 TaxID=2983214 RepID=UPI0023F87FA5|nr:DivIVA domain-containing protein [Bifidobacterium sp. ESL0690]WEV46241.1 DivIVA domain-containing protein [Bifidobacterium sp. ESL0690]
MALLSAEEVRNKAFQTVRFKEGYDVEEVDDFLDQVAHTLAEEERQISYLQGQLSGSPSGMGFAAGTANQNFVSQASSPFSSQGPQTGQPSYGFPSSQGLQSEQNDGGFSSSQQVSWEQ